MKQTILTMIQNTLSHWGLTDYVQGKVTSMSPFRVSVDDRLLLEKANLIFAMESPVFVEGDSLIMLRVLRGQRYLVLAKAVKE